MVDATTQNSLIIADDLTGALDSSAVLRRQGFQTTVVLDPAELAPAGTAEVLALTTETRHLADPGPVLQQLASRLPADRLLYKKIDSTLRGPLGVEIATLLDYSTAEAALVVPALPAQGRGLHDGRLLVNGRAQEVHLPQLLREQTGRPIGQVGIASVRGENTALKQEIERLASPGAIVVLDAIEEDDLRAIAEAIAGAGPRLLLAGSAGFAAWLPCAWRLATRPNRDEIPGGTAAPVLFVLGSPSPRTRAQVDMLRREIAVVDLEPTTSALAEAGRIVEAAVMLLAQKLDVALVLATGDDVRVEGIAPAVQQGIAAALATVAGRIMKEAAPRSLVLGGGDTAFAVCRELGIRAIALDGEVAPGLPLGHATTAAGHHLRVVTKAGGFGNDAALLVARKVLQGRTTAE